MILKEEVGEFEVCEFIEGKVFDVEGIFVYHLIFFGYTNLSKIFMPQEVEGDKIPENIVSTNVMKLKHINWNTQQRTDREFPYQAASYPNRPSHPSSSNRRISQRRTNVAGESNEGCSGGGDGEGIL